MSSCLFLSCRQLWNLQRKMFGLRLCLWLQPGTLCAVSRVQTVHKLASLQKVTALPPKKIQSLLYPFSELEAYLDRFVDSWFCTVLRHVFCHSLNLMSYVIFPGLWTRHSSSSFIPVWRTWLKQKSSSALRRLTGLITTPLQSGWTTYLLWNSQRLVDRRTGNSWVMFSESLSSVTLYLNLVLLY